MYDMYGSTNTGGPNSTLLGKIAEGVPVQNAGLSYIAGQQQRQSNVDRILKSVLEISKYDAAGATKVLAEESKNYPELEKFQGIQFRDETKNNWITASIGNGQTMMINMQTLGKIAHDPANKDKYLKDEAVTLGTPKMEKPRDEFDLFYQSQKAEGLTDAQINDAWEKRKINLKQQTAKDDTVKEFRQQTSKLESLYRRKSSIQQGYDPITMQIIPQTQRDAALGTINDAITDSEGYIQSVYPDQWKLYRKPAPTAGSDAPLWNQENPPAVPFSGNAPQTQSGTYQPPSIGASQGGQDTQGMPTAAQYPNKVIKDTSTGKRYRSDGRQWVEIR